MKRISIRSKLLLNSILIIVFTIIMVFIGFLEFNRSKTFTNNISPLSQQMAELVRLKSHFEYFEDILEEYFIIGGERYQIKINEAFDTIFATIEDIGQDAYKFDVIKDIKNKTMILNKLIEDLLNKDSHSISNRVENELIIKIYSEFKEINRLHNSYSEQTFDRLEYYIDAQQKGIKTAILEFFILGIIIIIFYLIYGHTLSKRILIPLLKLTDASAEIYKGNFKVEVSTDTNDEIGDLAQNFNKMAEKIKKSMQALKKSGKKYKSLFDKSNDGIILHDLQGIILDTNEKANIMLGYEQNELNKHSIEMIHPDSEKEVARQAFEKTKSKGKVKFETKFLKKDGTTIDVDISSSVVDHKKGIVQGIIRDISERKTMEIQLRQAQKMESIGTLAGGIAHDFNNLLSPILGYSELLKEDLPQDSSLQKSVSEILQASLRAKDLVKQILTFSRQHRQEFKPIRVQSVLKEALKFLGSSIPKTIDIQTKIDPDCGVVFADTTQIHQIIMNLVTNAYQAMQESGGQLKLVLGQTEIGADSLSHSELIPGKYALLKVIDTGPGIQKDVIDKIFDPYFTTKGTGKGTGLGLSVILGIVNNCKGDINVYSEPGKGTQVHVYLPIVKNVSDIEGSNKLQPIPGGTERILLVDDEEMVVKMEKQLLERMGYNVTSRTESIEAFEVFKTNPDAFDIIISDMTMPNMTGLQLANKVKAIRPDIPFVICTGFSDQITKESSKGLGIQGYVSKPIIKKDIAKIIRDVLDTDIET
jgi:PAS domain S-box-containing protein